jgi:hypothetical protein
MTEPYQDLGGRLPLLGKFKGKLPDWDGCQHTEDPWGNYLDPEGLPTGRRCPCCYEKPETVRDN